MRTQQRVGRGRVFLSREALLAVEALLAADGAGEGQPSMANLVKSWVKKTT